MVWKTLAAQLRTNSQLTYDPGRESNRGHLGERRALYAQANHAAHIKLLHVIFTPNLSPDTNACQ